MPFDVNHRLGQNQGSILVPKGANPFDPADDNELGLIDQLLEPEVPDHGLRLGRSDQNCRRQNDRQGQARQRAYANTNSHSTQHAF